MVEKNEAICPINGEHCLQRDNVTQVEKRMSIMESNFNGSSQLLKIMVANVDKTAQTVELLSENISKVFEMVHENALEIKDVAHSSKIANMQQDNKYTQKELNKFVEKKADKKKLTNKAKITFVGSVVLWFSLKVTGILDTIGDFLFESIK